MIQVKCHKCGEELCEPGGILLSPPIMQDYPLHWKGHLCTACWAAFMAWLTPAVAETPGAEIALKKSILVTCEECNRPYMRPCYDLDLKVGDRVVPESWVGKDYMEACVMRISDDKHKHLGLYFGWNRDPADDERIIHDVRIDTRNNKFVKV